MKLSYLGIFFFAILLSACSLTRPANRVDSQYTQEATRKAKDHYLSGALLDFQDQYSAAIFEYRKALSYDSSSAQILKAIGRNFYRTGQYQRSIEYLSKSYRRKNEDRETLYFLAEAHNQQRNYEDAAFYYGKLNEIDPLNPTVHSSLIYLYTKLGKVEELIALRERLVDLLDGESEFVHQLLTLYLQLNRMEKANNLVQDLLLREPDSPDNWLLYGNVLEMEGDTLSAITAYKKALKLEKDNEKAMNQLYILYRDLASWEEMVYTFSDIVNADPDMHRARLFLGEGYYYLDNYEEARNVLQPVLDNPALKDRAYLLMGRIAINQNLYDEAKTHFEELTTLEPWNGRAWEFLAVLLYEQEAYDKCAEVLSRAIESVPDNPALLSLFGNSLLQLNRLPEAVVPLEKAYELDNGNLNTITTLGSIYNDLRMFTELDSLYESALIQYPDNDLILNNYSYSLSVRGVRLDDAQEMAARAISKNPLNAAYLDTMGWIYYQKGEYVHALEYVQKAAEMAGGHPEILEHLGDIYLKLNQVEQAKNFWQQALDKSPDNESLRIKLGR